MITALQILVAWLLDRLLGEPRRAHPLVGFGRLAARIERAVYGGNGVSPSQRRLRGLLGWALAVMPFVLLAALLQRLPAPLAQAVGVALLYLALGGRSLREHGLAVVRALGRGDLALARRRVGYMVSRETVSLDAEGVRRATVESILENGNDAVFGALFWFALAGIPGVVLYRLANTLDAMWGYRNERYRHFGTFAARADDLLNWFPARLTGLAYGLAGRTRQALRCWRAQAPDWEGINPGVVMAAGAGALGLRLGGPARYHGIRIERPALGCGETVAGGDAIERALALLDRAQGLVLAAILTGGLFLA